MIPNAPPALPLTITRAPAPPLRQAVRLLSTAGDGALVRSLWEVESRGTAGLAYCIELTHRDGTLIAARHVLPAAGIQGPVCLAGDFGAPCRHIRGALHHDSIVRLQRIRASWQSRADLHPFDAVYYRTPLSAIDALLRAEVGALAALGMEATA